MPQAIERVLLEPVLDPERFKRDAALNEWDSSTFYGGDERGYTGVSSRKRLKPR